MKNGGIVFPIIFVVFFVAVWLCIVGVAIYAASHFVIKFW